MLWWMPIALAEEIEDPNAFVGAVGLDLGASVGDVQALRLGADLTARNGPWVFRGRLEGVPVSTTANDVLTCAMDCQPMISDRPVGATWASVGLGADLHGWRVEALAGPGVVFQQHSLVDGLFTEDRWVGGHLGGLGELAALSPTGRHGWRVRLAVDVWGTRTQPRDLSFTQELRREPIANGGLTVAGLRIGLSS